MLQKSSTGISARARCAGCRRNRPSPHRRSRRSMKITRSATLLAKPISCVTTIMVMPSRASSTMTSSTSLIISGSSAEVGSSNSIAIGSMASARAIATRCCWPPESSAGYLSRVRREPDPLQQLYALGHGLVVRPAQHLLLRQAQVLDHPQMREQFEMLEHHADAGAQLRQVGLGIVDLDAVEDDRRPLERLQRVDTFDQRRLARTRGAAHHHHLALGDAGRAIRQRLEARPVPLIDVADLDHRLLTG